MVSETFVFCYVDLMRLCFKAVLDFSCLTWEFIYSFLLVQLSLVPESTLMQFLIHMHTPFSPHSRDSGLTAIYPNHTGLCFDTSNDSVPALGCRPFVRHRRCPNAGWYFSEFLSILCRVFTLAASYRHRTSLPVRRGGVVWTIENMIVGGANCEKLVISFVPLRMRSCPYFTLRRRAGIARTFP